MPLFSKTNAKHITDATASTRDLIKLTADATDSQATVREWLDALSTAEVQALVDAVDLSAYLPLTGGTLTGSLEFGTLGNAALHSVIINSHGTINNATNGFLFRRNWYGTVYESGMRPRYNSAHDDISFWARDYAFLGSRNGGVSVSDRGIGYCSASVVESTPDTYVKRGSTQGTLQQVNGLDAQTYELFGTYTSDTSFERLRIGYSSADSGYLISQEIGSAGGTAQDIKMGHRNGFGTFAAGIRVETDGRVSILKSSIESLRIITNGFASGSQVGLVFESTFAGPYRFASIRGEARTGYAGAMVFGTKPSSGGSNGPTTERMRITETGLITFGGITSAFPALKQDGTAMKVRLGDDSADAGLTCGDLTASGTATIIPPTSDPGISGALWNNGGTLAISAG